MPEKTDVFSAQGSFASLANRRMFCPRPKATLFGSHLLPEEMKRTVEALPTNIRRANHCSALSTSSENFA